MMIACESCHSKYSIADDKVRGKTVRIRCRECQATIVVTGAALTAPPPASAVYEPQFHPRVDSPAAIVKRGGARVNRDFVAEARSEEVASVDRPSFGVTAQRNENSVLFTLADLARKPPAVESKPVEPSTSTINSGLIDLNGMTAVRGRSKSLIQPVFGSSPPFGPVTMEVDHEAPPPPNRRKLFVGIGATAALLTIVALGFGMAGGPSGESKSAAAGSRVSAAPPATLSVAPLPVEPVAVPAPIAAAAIPTSDTATSSSTAHPGKKGKKSSGWAAVNAVKTTRAPKPSHERAASAKPHGGSDACGCNGELMCLMRCSK